MKVFDWLGRITSVIGVTIFSGMFLMMLYIVFARYILGITTDWAEELVRYLVIWTGCWVAWLCVRDESHPSFVLVLTGLPSGMQRWFQIVVSLIGAIFCAWFCYLSTFLVRRCYIHSSRSETLDWPMWIIYSFFTLGMVLLTIGYVERLIKFIAAKPSTSEI